MTKRNQIQIFNEKKVRTVWDSDSEEWYFSVIEVVEILTEIPDPSAYWRKLKQRLKAEGNETVTNCHRLKLQAADGKMRMTDVATSEQLFRIIQSSAAQKAYQSSDVFSIGKIMKVLFAVAADASTKSPRE